MNILQSVVDEGLVNSYTVFFSWSSGYDVDPYTGNVVEGEDRLTALRLVLEPVSNPAKIASVGVERTQTLYEGFIINYQTLPEGLNVGERVNVTLNGLAGELEFIEFPAPYSPLEIESQGVEFTALFRSGGKEGKVPRAGEGSNNDS